MSGQSAPMAIPRGTVLFRPEQACQGFVVVRSGSIKVSLTAENGREIVLYRVRPGEVCLQTFGCLVKGNPYSAEGVAESDIEIEVIPAGEFQRRIESDLAFRQQLFSAVAARFADLERLVEDVALSSIEERLARALLRLAGPGDRLDATHEALATEIGSAREVVSRQLGLFARAGLIAASRGHIDLIDRPGLEALAHSAA
ncbi:MAG: Crp/Fnr family transcriptional regulator [Sphingomonadales bacterium]|nr:Crp/Fnr family transcriptional regulator [Sphingomonadales bacterium]